MALNCSHQPIFRDTTLEDGLVDPIRISNGGYLVEGILKNNVDAFGKGWYLNPKWDDSFYCGRETYRGRGYGEYVATDVVDLLPSDPFGMDISSTFTAITDWLDDFEADFGGYGSNEVGVSKRECQSFAGLNFIWDSAVRLQAFQGNNALNYKHNAASWFLEEAVTAVACPVDFGSASSRQGVTNGYYSGNGSANVTCPMAARLACNLESMNGGYSVGEKVVGSLCNLNGMNGEYSSQEKMIEDVSCPIVCGSACSTQDIRAGYYLEKEEVNEVRNGSVGLGLTHENAKAKKKINGGSVEKGARNISCPGVLGSAYDIENISIGSGGCSEHTCENILEASVANQAEDWRKGYSDRLNVNVEEICPAEDHHLVWGLVIGCLGVRDLLSVESACRSLRVTVKNEPHLWTKIHVGHPLNEKITDEQLLQLTDRAQGELQCLSLVGCTRITNDGLKCIIGSNPKLAKLSVPGCTNLTIEGIVSNLKSLKSTGATGVRHLKIGALHSAGVEEYFEELKLLLGIDGKMQQHDVHKPHFYHMQQSYLSCDDDDRALDIEICPKCEKLRLVYDCTAAGCQRVEQGCRACRLCIERCVKCGRCIKDGEYEETFCLDWLCSLCEHQENPNCAKQ